MDVRKRIGYLPEIPPLYPDMTVRSYLEFVGRIKGITSDKLVERVNTALSLASIEDKSSDLIKRLSRGYRQRVGLAQALVHNPDVIILDEPTVGLDPKQIIEVRKLIKGLAGEHTIILSTHILPEVSMTCDRVVIINKGRIAAVDTPENLTSQLKGAERIYIEAKGEPEKLKSVLEGIKDITHVGIESLEGSDSQSINIESSCGHDLRGEVAATIVRNGFELLELRSVALSLEEIFLQLTTEEQSAKTEGTPEAA
jgi:ABC-2 type transport system ATP-binding protein